MTSHEVIEYIEKIGIQKLYEKYMKYFQLVDSWSNKLIEGDLLSEYDLAYCHDQLQGIHAKLYPIAQVLESYIQSKMANTKLSEHKKLEKYRTQDSTILNAHAEADVKDFDLYLKDFNSYAETSKQLAIGCQARMKRLSIDKGLKGVDYTGEVPVQNNGTGQKPVGGSW